MGQVQCLGQLCSICSSRAGWGLFQFNFSIWDFSANSGFFGFVSCYCPFPVFAVSPAFLKGVWVSRVGEKQLPGCAAPPSPASGSQSGCPGAAPDSLFSLQTLQLTATGIHLLPVPTETRGMNLVFDLAQCSTGEWQETFLQGWK